MEIKVVMQHKINTVGIKLLQYYCMTSWLWRLPNSSFASFRCWLWGYSRKVRRACLASCSTSGGVAPAGEGHVCVCEIGWLVDLIYPSPLFTSTVNPSLSITHPSLTPPSLSLPSLSTLPSLSITHPFLSVTHPSLSITHPSLSITHPSLSITHPSLSLSLTIHPALLPQDPSKLHPFPGGGVSGKHAPQQSHYKLTF